MPAAFYAATPDGHLQLDDGLVYFSLFAKSVIPIAGWGSGGTPESYYDLFVPGLTTADAPMIALYSPQGSWASIVSTSGGITWRIWRSDASSVITAYIFSKRRPPDPGFGLALYDAGGNIVYSAATPIARPLGLFADGSYVGASIAGKACAHVPMKMANIVGYTVSFGNLGSCMVSPNQQGYSTFRRDYFQRSAVAATVGSVTYQPREFTGGLSPFGSCSSTNFGYQALSRSSKYSSLIIDVSGL